MKRIILSFALLGSLLASAQSPIHHFSGLVNGGNGISSREYQRGTFTIPADETASGPNASWDFSSVNFDDAELYSNANPSATTISTYPGCSLQTSLTADGGTIGEMFSTLDATGGFTLLGNVSYPITFNFSSDTAFVGQFPMSYGYNSSDTVAGTFSYDGPEGSFSGNISGTLVSTFDSYGQVSYNGTTFSADRLKVLLTLSFGTTDNPNAGTIVQTSYFYYNSGESQYQYWPVIRSVHRQINVPSLNISKNDIVLEKGTALFLGTNNVNSFQAALYPNPASEVLNVTSENQILSLTVIGIDGKLISKSTGNKIGVSQLNCGLYVVGIETSVGTLYKKFVKK